MEFGASDKKSILQRREAELIGFNKCNEYVCVKEKIKLIKIENC